MDVVPAVRAALIEQIGQQRFDRWFAADATFRMHQNRLSVIVSNAFYENWLRRNFRAQLETVAGQVCRRDVQVEFLVDPSRCNPSPSCDAAATASNVVSPAASAAVVPAAACSDAHPAISLATADSVSDKGQSASPKTPPTLSLVRSVQEPGCSSAEPPSTSQRATSSTRRRRFLRLDEFVVGESNKLAATSARMVCDEPGRYSPLFIHGPTGVGKTHLLEGIWGRIRNTRPQMRCVFLTAEQFTSYFLAALRGSGLPSFRRKYRDVDLLVIDDAQFFAGKRATSVEMLYTINTLLEMGRQIVVSADRPLSELRELGHDLIARLQSGMRCGIEPPDYNVRLGVLRRLANKTGQVFPEEVLEFVASRLKTHAWELSGAIHRLAATHEATGQPLSVEMAEKALAELLRQQERVVRLPDVEKAVCSVLGIDPKALQSNQKARHVSYPRMLAMWLARKHTRAALAEIGRYFGRRSHATVIAAQKKVAGWIDQQAPLRLADRDWNVEEAIRRVEEQLMTG